MTIGIIMAAGKGKRFGANAKNKTAEVFNGKPIVKYGVELFEKTVDQIVVVVGVAAESVKESIGESDKVIYAFQPEPNGTGGAFQAAMKKIIEMGWKPDLVIAGNGDHMMFYQPDTVEKLLRIHEDTGSAVVMVSTLYPEDPNKFAWGRVVRNRNKEVVKIVEQKDATEEEKKIAELNVNFYGFDFEFAEKYYRQIQPSPLTGEYYITEMVELAARNNYRVEALITPFEQVGIGINTREELKESESLYKQKTAC